MTDGLIIREYNGVGEADRFITALTRERGVIRAAARGARRIKSRAGAATQLLCYSRLRLITGRDAYIVEDAQPIELFFGLRDDIEKMALGQYFCELAAAVCPTDEPAQDSLRLLLSALHYLAENARPLPLLKATVEWRLLSCAGYMPNIAACARCGKSTADMRFSAAEGTVYCSDCDRGSTLPLTAGALSAIRHVTAGPLEKCFAFTLAPAALQLFSEAAELFVKTQLQRSFKTLDFFHTLHKTGVEHP